MGEQEILARLQGLLGADATYVVDPHAPSASERQRIQKTMDEAAADAAEAEIEMESLLSQKRADFTRCDPRALPGAQGTGGWPVGTHVAASGVGRAPQQVRIQARRPRR